MTFSRRPSATRRERRLTPKAWDAASLERLDDEALLRVYEEAICDRSQLKAGIVQAERKVKRPAPPHSFELLEREAQRRGLSDEAIRRIVANAVAGRSFISHVVAPCPWRHYEIHAANAVTAHLRSLGVTLDEVRYDVDLVSKVAGRPVQVDALLVRHQPKHVVAVEIKYYPDRLVTVEELRAFVTTVRVLPVNAGAFVTPRGYQRGAIDTAKHFGIELLLFTQLTVEQARQEFPEELAGERPGAGNGPYWRFADLNGNSELFVGQVTQPPRSSRAGDAA